MGLSFSKSIKVGLFRFNLSGSGIGVSAGIPGLRIGTGPRGAYISGSVSGFRYRQSLRASRPAPTSSSPAKLVPPQSAPSAPQYQPNVVSTVQHDTKSVLELADTSSDELVETLNEQSQRNLLWPWAGGGALLCFGWLKGNTAWPDYVHVSIFFILIGLVFWLYCRDQARRLTVLFFDLDPTTEKTFSALSSAIEHAATSRKLRAIASTARYGDTRYSAGASTGLQFQEAVLALGQAPGVAANLPVPLLKTKRRPLHSSPTECSFSKVKLWVLLRTRNWMCTCYVRSLLRVKNSPPTQPW
jgi:hypothetical protein